MSIAAARSPSPDPPARPCCGGLRRSADSSPFRPAASPLDSPQRSSVCKHSGRVSPRAWGGEKENDPRERDAAGAGAASARAQKVRSSGGGCGGVCVTKSFMAPTISAASKAIAPSPRKKILGERNNDPVPSSPLDLAHGGGKPRGPHPPPPDEAALGAPRRLRLSLDGAPAPPPPPAAGPVVSRRSFGGDEAAAVVVEDPVSVNGHHVADSADAEAVAAAPYDPKTNYLSPRPRFLRYQPNRHLEIYRHGGGCARGLGDSFASESSSEEIDAANTTEEEEVSVEEQPDDSSEEETSALASPPSEGRAQSAAPALDGGAVLPLPALDSPLPRVLTPEEKEFPRAGGVLIPEQEPAASPARASPKKKRFLLAPLALVLLMVAAFVCVPPPPGHPVMLNTPLSKVSEFLSVQESHPVDLAARLKQWSSSSLDFVELTARLKEWSSSSLDFVTSYWEAIASYQERDVFGPHFAANLSAAAAADVDADYDVAFYYTAVQTSPISLENELGIQEVVSESDTEMIAGPDVEELATYGDPDAKPIDDIEMEQEDVSGVPSAMEEAKVDAEVEEFNAEMAEELSDGSGEEMAASIQNSGIPSQSTPEPEPEQAEGIDKASLQQDVQTEDSEGDHDDGKEDQEVHHGNKLGSDMWPSYLDKISKPAAIGAALAAIVVPAALAFLYMRQKQARVASNEPAEHVEQVEQVEQFEQVGQVESLSGSGSSQGHVVAKGSLFQSSGIEETERLAAKGSLFQSSGIEETERLGTSGPSQYSSSLSSGLGRRRNTKGEDAGLQPVASRTRRDSTDQSTSSYGSFTTYQKIPAKKGNKEDEAMTPVRRSSRLRNVKTPEA